MSKEIKAAADKAIELNPNSDLSHHVLGRWHQNLANLSGFLKFFAGVFFGGVPPGTNEEAVSHFSKAIELGGDKPQWLYRLGVLHDKNGAPDQALPLLVNAVELMPDEPKFHQYLGFVYEGQGRHDEAVGHFKSVMELEGAGEEEL